MTRPYHTRSVTAGIARGGTARAAATSCDPRRKTRGVQSVAKRPTRPQRAQCRQLAGRQRATLNPLERALLRHGLITRILARVCTTIIQRALASAIRGSTTAESRNLEGPAASAVVAAVNAGQDAGQDASQDASQDGGQEAGQDTSAAPVAQGLTAPANVSERGDAEAVAPQQTQVAQAPPIDTTRGDMREPCLPPLFVYVDRDPLSSYLYVRASFWSGMRHTTSRLYVMPPHRHCGARFVFVGALDGAQCVVSSPRAHETMSMWAMARLVTSAIPMPVSVGGDAWVAWLAKFERANGFTPRQQHEMAEWVEATMRSCPDGSVMAVARWAESAATSAWDGKPNAEIILD